MYIKDNNILVIQISSLVNNTGHSLSDFYCQTHYNASILSNEWWCHNQVLLYFLYSTEKVFQSMNSSWRSVFYSESLTSITTDINTQSLVFYDSVLILLLSFCQYYEKLYYTCNMAICYMQYVYFYTINRNLNNYMFFQCSHITRSLYFGKL